MTDYRFMYGLPDFVEFTLKGVKFTCLVRPWVDGTLRQVRYEIVAHHGKKTAPIRSIDIRIHFILALRKDYNIEYLDFMLGV